MLKINNTEFKIKFTEINIRQRVYKKKSYITLNINTEFFPSYVDGQVVSGAIDVKLDVQDIHSLDDLIGKKYKGDIGTVSISVNNDGIWEHQSYDQFEINISNRNGRELTFELSTEICQLDTVGTMVSLYTTSSSIKELKKHFDLKDFYQNQIVKEIGQSKIIKYYVADKTEKRNTCEKSKNH